MKTILMVLLLAAGTTGLLAHEGHEPAETDFQSDVCLQCNMKVTSKSYAAQITLADKGLFFDDIGCLVQYERTGQVDQQKVHARYVRTVPGDAWVDVTKAVWVQTKDVRTPMGYGFHAFADKKSADAWVKKKKNASYTTWKDLQASVPEAPKAMEMM